MNLSTRNMRNGAFSAILAASLVLPGAAYTASDSFPSLDFTSHTSKKTDFGPRDKSVSKCREAPSDRFIDSHSCTSTGGHGDSLSCKSFDGKKKDVKVTLPGGTDVTIKLLSQACCKATARLHGGVGNIGKTARVDCRITGKWTEIE